MRKLIHISKNVVYSEYSKNLVFSNLVKSVIKQM